MDIFNEFSNCKFRGTIPQNGVNPQTIQILHSALPLAVGRQEEKKTGEGLSCFILITRMHNTIKDFIPAVISYLCIISSNSPGFLAKKHLSEHLLPARILEWELSEMAPGIFCMQSICCTTGLQLVSRFIKTSCIKQLKKSINIYPSPLQKVEETAPRAKNKIAFPKRENYTLQNHIDFQCNVILSVGEDH